MKGLYFYKLMSPYKEDITKDCKLTVNEIDHNFITLKDASVKEVRVDNENGYLILELNNGESLKADISNFTKDFSVEYDIDKGVIHLHHGGTTEVIEGLVTSHNITKYNTTITDETLFGYGINESPLGISIVEKTGYFRPVEKVIDKTKGEYLPSPRDVKKGERYLTLEYMNPYGYLYNYASAKRFAEDAGDGWRIPTKEDWDAMLNAIELCDENRNHQSISCNHMFGKVAGKLLKSKNHWFNPDDKPCDDSCKCKCDCDCNDDLFDEKPKEKCNPNGLDSYGMGLLPAGYGDGCLSMDYFGTRGKYWTSSSIQVTDVYTKRFDYDKGGVVQIADSPRALCSLRLVKDYDGRNFNGVDTINTTTYKTNLMPSTTAKTGYAIWMATNVASNHGKYNPTEPNGGEFLSKVKVYYINEWNGLEWVKKNVVNGDSFVIKRADDGTENNEFRMINHELVNVNALIVKEVINKYDTIIEEITNKLDDVEYKVDQEIVERQRVDEQMWGAINSEFSARTESDNQLWEAINSETTQRNEVDAQIWEALNTETAQRNEVDAQIWEALNQEVEDRNAVNAQIWEALNTETAQRNEVDAQIWEALNNESSARTEVEAQLWSAINTEAEQRNEVDAQIWKSLNDEIDRSIKKDEYIEGRLIKSDGSSYNCSEGKLTLATENPEHTVIINLDSNYGTF